MGALIDRGAEILRSERQRPHRRRLQGPHIDDIDLVQRLVVHEQPRAMVLDPEILEVVSWQLDITNLTLVDRVEYGNV